MQANVAQGLCSLSDRLGKQWGPSLSKVGSLTAQNETTWSKNKRCSRSCRHWKSGEWTYSDHTFISIWTTRCCKISILMRPIPVSSPLDGVSVAIWTYHHTTENKTQLQMLYHASLVQLMSTNILYTSQLYLQYKATQRLSRGSRMAIERTLVCRHPWWPQTRQSWHQIANFTQTWAVVHWKPSDHSQIQRPPGTPIQTCTQQPGTFQCRKIVCKPAKWLLLV